jgi:putative hydrolase of the HAD superfamily
MSPPAGVKAVLFDAGGTLIHLDGERVCSAAGVEPDAAAFTRAEAESTAAMRAWILENPRSTDAERLPLFLDGILRRLGIADDEGRRAAARAVGKEHARANLWSRGGKGGRETLAALRQRGYRVGVVSNADGRVRRLLEQAGLSPFLEVVIDSAEVGIEKPDPRIFFAATERLGVESTSCAYVGDIYEIDVVGARAAGMHPILIGSGVVPESVTPVDRIGALKDLLDVFPDPTET